MTKNVILFGLGSIGLKHLALIQKEFKNTKLIILKSSKTNISNYKNIIFVDNFNNLKNITIFCAIICTPSNTHIKYAKKLSKITKKIFIEKPLSNNLSDSKNFLNFIKNEDIHAYVGYNLNFDPVLLYVENIIKKKDPLDIFSVNIESQSFLPSWRKNSDYKRSVSAQKKLGGGVLLELSHEINYLLKIFGKIKSVYAITRNSKTLDINVEDFADIIMENNYKTIFRIHLNFNSKRNVRKCEIVTKKETIEADLINSKVLIYYKTGRIVNKKFSSKSSISYKNQFKEFFKKPSKSKKAQNILLSIETLKIIDAIRLSSKIKRKVFVK